MTGATGGERSDDEAWRGHRRGTPGFTRMLVAMFCAGVATFAQLYAPQPVLPSISDALGVDAASGALMVSAGTLGLALFALPWTYVADRWGKVPTMIAAVCAATVLGLLIPWVPQYGVLLLLRFVQGAALAGMAGVAVAYIAEETHALHAGIATGLYVSGTTIGGLSGRLIAGPLAQASGDWRIALTGVSVVGAAAAVAFVVLVPRARRFTPSPARGALRQTASRVAGHLRNPRMLSLFLLAFILMGAFVTVYNYVSFKLEAPPYLLSQGAIALIFLAYLSGTFTSTAAGRLVARWGQLRVTVLGILVMLLGLGLTVLDPFGWVLTGIVLLTMGFFAAHSVASGWTGQLAGAARAQGTALYNVFYYLGSALIGWRGGLLLRGRRVAADRGLLRGARGGRQRGRPSAAAA
ncbi:MFS transporter [Rothia sp. AR01]|uniref:MFS transporter n=1 Tax=Rothia santali TaxID=2949643 RepID=A0A9X2KI15_9MICC|nr:MFS transporter [Rothia santali]MCP3426427.1 MFS transporter [Rothia santali]